MLSLLEASLNLGYLDGTVKTVASDVAKIIKADTEIDLSVNVSKCELKHFQVDDALLQSLHRVEFEDAILLAAPLFPGALSHATPAVLNAHLYYGRVNGTSAGDRSI